MIHIQELLNRIKWDKDFGNSDFVIGYLDRIQDRIVKVPFEEIILVSGEHHSFKVIDDEGVVRTVPFHRVKVVYKDGKLIWQRNY